MKDSLHMCARVAMLHMQIQAKEKKETAHEAYKLSLRAAKLVDVNWAMGQGYRLGLYVMCMCELIGPCVGVRFMGFSQSSGVYL